MVSQHLEAKSQKKQGFGLMSEPHRKQAKQAKPSQIARCVSLPNTHKQQTNTHQQTNEQTTKHTPKQTTTHTNTQQTNTLAKSFLDTFHKVVVELLLILYK